MTILQLQRLNQETFENEGGLYIIKEHVAAFVPDRISSEVYGRTNVTWVHMLNGDRFLTPFHITEILDMIGAK